MKEKLWKLVAGTAALVALALGGAALASAGSASKGATQTTTSTTAMRPAHTPETPLTGDTLSKASAAAVAKVGGTVDFASTENDGTIAGAAYEVHVTKPDGTHVEVVLDTGFAVLAVRTGGPHGGLGHGLGGPGGPGGPGGNGETPLTGDTATKAKAAAVAKTGGSADFASTENDGTLSGAAYEVHVTKADGTHVEVILDKDFTVLAVNAKQHP
jgi:uncharacterized membrane protein YkoI